MLWCVQGQAESSNGPFGRGSGAGCAVQACLVRSALQVEPADCHLMPCPRGALENVRLMPLEEPHPGPGEVKASSHPWKQCIPGCWYHESVAQQSC